MALAAPDVSEYRHRRHLTDRLITLESSAPSLEGMRGKLVYALIWLACVLVSATLNLRFSAAERSEPRYQAGPDLYEVDPQAAVASAFTRSIMRDSADYTQRRNKSTARTEFDPPMAGSDDELFPGLAAYRKSIGV